MDVAKSANLLRSDLDSLASPVLDVWRLKQFFNGFRMKNTGINFDYLRILYKFVVLKAMKRRQRDAAVPLSCYILTSGVPTSLVCGNV